MTGPTEMNIDPNRAAFVAICAEAWRRDAAAGLITGPSEPDPAGPPDAAASPAAEPEPEGQGTLGDWPPGSYGEAAR
jgi:hypothetical protein